MTTMMAIQSLRIMAMTMTMIFIIIMTIIYPQGTTIIILSLIPRDCLDQRRSFGIFSKKWKRSEVDHDNELEQEIFNDKHDIIDIWRKWNIVWSNSSTSWVNTVHWTGRCWSRRYHSQCARLAHGEYHHHHQSLQITSAQIYQIPARPFTVVYPSQVEVLSAKS